jgi:hypothetical protein
LDRAWPWGAAVVASGLTNVRRSTAKARMNQIDTVRFPYYEDIEDALWMTQICCVIVQRDYSLWQSEPANRAISIMRTNSPAWRARP